jgi:transposase
LQAFFEQLGDRRHSIRAISIDMSAGYENAIKAVAERDEQFRPQIVFDPFHVCQLASRAVDDVRRAEWNEHGKSKTKGGHGSKDCFHGPEPLISLIYLCSGGVTINLPFTPSS